MKKFKISVCCGKFCILRNAELRSIVQHKKDESGKSYVSDLVELDRCGCLGNCHSGPNILVEDVHQKMRIIKNGITPTRLKQEMERLEQGKTFVPIKNTRKSLNDYLSGGF